MKNNFEDKPQAPVGETLEPQESSNRTDGSSQPSHWVQSLLHMGLGESMSRAATNIFSLISIGLVIWLVQMYFQQPAAQVGPSAQPQPTPSPMAAPASGAPSDLSSSGILRQTDIHTNIPARPRPDIVQYKVQAGDTVSSIADTYGLQVDTIFAANYAVLQDDPESLRPGQTLRILPVDGVYWEWLGGLSFGDWAAYFKVKPEDIISYPPNHIDASTVGDYANANIKVNTWLIIPGGVYQYHTPGQIPLGITRTNPATAQVAGAGYCPPVTGGAVGTGTFVYPTDRHYLSGFDYSTKTHHLGIDLAANLGDNIYAADGGVIVYAGANSYGYGNMIMIDHGTGFQSLYAHLSKIFVRCGDNVTQGQVIGAAGATGNASGPHLHFEVRTTDTVINPWNVLPPRSPAP